MKKAPLNERLNLAVRFTPSKPTSPHAAIKPHRAHTLKRGSSDILGVANSPKWHIRSDLGRAFGRPRGI